MDRNLDIRAAIDGATETFRASALDFCAPWLLLYVGYWAVDQLLKRLFPHGFYVIVLCFICLLMPFAEFWCVLLVSARGLRSAGGESLAASVRKVAAIRGLWRLLFGLYRRLAVLAVVAVIAGFAAMIGWFIVHGASHTTGAKHHVRHPTATWMLVVGCYLLVAVLFNRYMFVLPRLAILQSGEANVFGEGIGLGRKYRRVVVAVAIVQTLLISIPILAVQHFGKYWLQTVWFGVGGAQLLELIISAVGTTWFVLFKLRLTEQALLVGLSEELVS